MVGRQKDHLVTVGAGSNPEPAASTHASEPVDDSTGLTIDDWVDGLRLQVGARQTALALLDADRVTSEQLSPATITRSPGRMEAPVTVNGQVLGVLAAGDDDSREWSARDSLAMQRTADAVAAKLELAAAKAQVQRERERVASHNRVHDLIARAEPLERVLEEIVLSVERHDPSLIGCAVLLDRRSSTLHPGAGPSLPPHYLAAIDGVVIGPNVGSCGAAAWSGELTRADDIATDPKWAPIRELAASASIGHCWSNPIKSPDGDVLGTLAFYGRQPREPLPEHLELLDEWARVAGIAIERHRTLERLVHDARHDGLTGLPNRRAIFDALEQAIVRAGPERQLAVLFIDLDGLKALNDTLGHDRADEMLREVAERLSVSIRDTDFVGRFGGDEFIVIAEQIADQQAAGELGLRLLDAISHPLPGLEQISVTASIGIAQLQSSSVDAREAIRQADGAMYAAKRAGRDRCVFVEGKQRVRAGRRLTIARELRGAEMRGEMHLVYQPVFELRTDEIVGVEALLRWTNPRLGDVSPMEFIPVAEDTGAILPIGAWVLRESSEAISQLSSKLDRKLELSVNVSANQLSNPSFAHWVTQTIAHAELPAELLTLEITESALMRPTATTKRTLHELASTGIRIVLDDFGTGFSSISWLKEHPLGAIKIDRDFIAGLPQDPRDFAIVAAMLGMGAALGCTVTAEGVETKGQLAALRELGCERMQGFLLARPAPLSELAPKLTGGPAIGGTDRAGSDSLQHNH